MAERGDGILTREGGWRIPVHFGDVRAEWRALHETVGLCDRSGRGKLRLTGRDRASFLQGLVTNDVSDLQPGCGTYALLVDPKGSTLSDLWIHHRGTHFLVETDHVLRWKVQELLERYVVSEDVEVEDVTAEDAVIGVQGPASRRILTILFYEVPETLPEMHSIERLFQGRALRVVARDYTGQGGYDIWTPEDVSVPLWEALLVRGRRLGATAVGAQAVEATRIEAGIPRYGMDVDESVFPQEAGLTHAVSFEKGCYIGQEAVAKMQYRGKPRRILVRLTVERGEAPPQKTPLFVAGEEAGHVTSSSRLLGSDRVHLLGYLRRGCHATGTKVAVGSPEGPVATVRGEAGSGSSLAPTPDGE